MPMSELMKQRYKNYFDQKTGVADLSGPIGKGVGEEKYAQSVKDGVIDAQGNPLQLEEEAAPAAGGQKEGGGGGMSGAPQGGSPAALVGQAGMMSGNPYLMGAGLGLSVLAQGEQNKRAQENAQREAYNERIKQRQMMMQKIAEMGIK
jgi:hypothetical protein